MSIQSNEYKARADWELWYDISEDKFLALKYGQAPREGRHLSGDAVRAFMKMLMDAEQRGFGPR